MSILVYDSIIDGGVGKIKIKNQVPRHQKARYSIGFENALGKLVLSYLAAYMLDRHVDVRIAPIVYFYAMTKLLLFEDEEWINDAKSNVCLIYSSGVLIKNNWPAQNCKVAIPEMQG